MKWLKTLSPVLLLLFVSCIQHQDEVPQIVKESESVFNFRPAYAKGFIVENDTLILRNPKDTNEVYQKLALEKKTRLVLQSTTHVPYIEKINPELIIGCNFTDRIKSPLTKKRIENKQVEEMLSGSHFDYEKLIDMSPDAILVYPFDTKEIKVLEEMKLNHILCFEYLEETLLARAEWITFFGAISGELERSKSIFEGIEKRFNAIQPGSIQDTILINLPFGDQWNVPTGISATSELITKSGYHYPWKDNNSEGNISVSKEEIIELGMIADTWIIFAGRKEGFSMNDLIAEDPLYANFTSVKNGKVVFCNTMHTPYFEEANLEPDVMVQNLISTASTGEKSKYFVLLK